MNNIIGANILTAEDSLTVEISPDIAVVSDFGGVLDFETLTRPRPLKEIQEEFCHHYRNGSALAYRMGELLIAAKAQLPEYGMWAKWLSGTNFPERQAQRLIRLARNYPDATTSSELGLSKALALLNLKYNERNEFIKKPHKVLNAAGEAEEKYVCDMTVRQLERAIQEYTGIFKKNSTSKITAQRFPIMLPNAAREASGNSIDYEGSFQYLGNCISELADSIQVFENGSQERDNLTEKLRDLVNGIFERIPMIRDF